MSVAALLATPPDTAHGTPLGVGDWRYVVEVLLPTADSAIWGTSLWGTGLWATFEWVDLTPWCRGEDWQRGSDEPFGRPRVGEARITLDSDGGRWNPWNPSPPSGSPAYFSVGTIVRIGIRSATDTRADGWIPQFCGIVDQWTPEYKGPSAVEKFVDLVVVETLRDLATIDENGLAVEVGAGENPVDRLERLLDAAGWQYGLLVEAGQLLASPGSYPLLGTNLSANRLTECYQVADSCDVLFRTDRTGAAIATNIEYIGSRPGGTSSDEYTPLGVFSKSGIFPALGFDWYARTSSALRYVPYDVDSFKSTNGDDAIVNDARFARAGGTVQSFEQLESIERFGRRTLTRTDLLCTSDAVAKQIAQYTTIRRALTTLRVNSLTVSPIDHGTDVTLTTLAADVQSLAFVFSPDMATGSSGRPYLTGFVSALSHQVRPMNPNRVQWTSTFGIDTRNVFNIPGAQLTATPA